LCWLTPASAPIDEAINRHFANEERLLLSLSEAEQETLSALPKKLIAALRVKTRWLLGDQVGADFRTFPHRPALLGQRRNVRICSAPSFQTSENRLKFESAPLGPDGQIFNRMLGSFSQVSTGRLRTADCWPLHLLRTLPCGNP
jgi:hypothetical protein